MVANPIAPLRVFPPIVLSEVRLSVAGTLPIEGKKRVEIKRIRLALLKSQASDLGEGKTSTRGEYAPGAYAANFSSIKRCKCSPMVG